MMCGVLFFILLGITLDYAPDACAKNRLLSTGKGPIDALKIVPFVNALMWIDLEEFDDIAGDLNSGVVSRECKNSLRTSFAFAANSICVYYGCDVNLIGYLPIVEKHQSRFLNGLVTKDKLAWSRYAKSFKKTTFQPKSEALLLAQEAKFYGRCDAYLEYVTCAVQKLLNERGSNGYVTSIIKPSSVLYQYDNVRLMRQFIDANGGALDFFTTIVLQYMCKFVFSTCPPLFIQLRYIHARMFHWCSVIDFYTPVVQRENLYTFVGNDMKSLLEREAKLTSVFDSVESDLVSSQVGFPLVGKNSPQDLANYKNKVCQLRCNAIGDLWVSFNFFLKSYPDPDTIWRKAKSGCLLSFVWVLLVYYSTLLQVPCM